jgi:hypothetical protein
MRRRLAILFAASVLACWTWAQDAVDPHQNQTQAAQGQTQSQPDQDQGVRAGGLQDGIRIISGPTVEPQDTGATVHWKTNKKATTLVRYGSAADHLDHEQGQKGGSTSHTITLAELQPGTVYYFAIMTDDDQMRTQGQFQTTGEAIAQNSPEQSPSAPDQSGSAQPPSASGTDSPGPAAAQAPANVLVIIKGPDVEFVTPTAAVIDWSTNARSSSIVHYGTDKNNLNQMDEAPWGSSFHRVAVQNLQPSTIYYFFVESSQAEGTGSSNKSAVAGFQTPAPGSQARYNPPVIH